MVSFFILNYMKIRNIYVKIDKRVIMHRYGDCAPLMLLYRLYNVYIYSFGINIIKHEKYSLFIEYFNKKKLKLNLINKSKRVVHIHHPKFRL